jgi:hypothetical protein
MIEIQKTEHLRIQSYHHCSSSHYQTWHEKGLKPKFITQG